VAADVVGAVDGNAMGEVMFGVEVGEATGVDGEFDGVVVAVHDARVGGSTSGGASSCSACTDRVRTGWRGSSVTSHGTDGGGGTERGMSSSVIVDEAGARDIVDEVVMSRNGKMTSSKTTCRDVMTRPVEML